MAQMQKGLRVLRLVAPVMRGAVVKFVVGISPN